MQKREGKQIGGSADRYSQKGKCLTGSLCSGAGKKGAWPVVGEEMMPILPGVAGKSKRACLSSDLFTHRFHGVHAGGLHSRHDAGNDADHCRDDHPKEDIAERQSQVEVDGAG